MRFPTEVRFLQYCVSKRRTYLRQLFERGNPRGFFDLWRGELELSSSRFEVKSLSAERCRTLGQDLRWLLLQDLHRIVRNVVPEFAPAPPSVLESLRGALHQVRVARSMLIAGEDGVGKEQLAILLHVLAGRPGALVRVAASELGRGSAPARQLMPERGSVFIANLEDLDEIAQEELLVFLNGEARRRDLLFFVATRAEPRELIARHGVRRDLFVRVSQTEVRLPPLRDVVEQAPAFVGDILFDLARVPSRQLPALRDHAATIAESWRNRPIINVPPNYDYFSEALSYVLWQGKKEIANETLRRVVAEHLVDGTAAGNFRDLSERTASSLEAIRTPAKESTRRGRGESTFETRERSEPSNEARRDAGDNDDAALTGLRRDDLLRRYYRALIREERGNMARVAARAGRKLRDLHAELARLDVRSTRYEPQSRSAS